MRRRLLLARHGETEWNAIGRLQGHTDIPLNERGRGQARELAAALADHGIERVVTSDLIRARETGSIVAQALGLPAPDIVPELRERRFGVFEGLTRDECRQRYPAAWQAWHDRTGVPDGAEALDVAVERMHAALAVLLAERAATALVVSHGGIMRLWLAEVSGAAVPPLPNGATYLVDHDGARFSAVALVSGVSAAR
jgi:probable phosphoglycerate mutase